jgi:hypothetical protein
MLRAVAVLLVRLAAVALHAVSAGVLPESQTLLLHGSATIYCIPKVDDMVEWRYRPPNSTVQYWDITFDGHGKNGLADRVTVAKESDKVYKLTISNLVLNDSGSYVCMGGYGFDVAPTGYSQLIVQDTSAILTSSTVPSDGCEEFDSEHLCPCTRIGFVLMALIPVSFIIGMAGLVCLHIRLVQMRKNVRTVEMETLRNGKHAQANEYVIT